MLSRRRRLSAVTLLGRQLESPIVYLLLGSAALAAAFGKHQIGEVQLPEAILEVHAQVRFSWIILGHEPRSAVERLMAYPGILAHGTSLTAAECDRMIPQLSATSVRQAMRWAGDEHRLRLACQAVLEYMQSHPIAATWGRADLASPNMMSLFHAQPIVLNERQAGAALEAVNALKRAIYSGRVHPMQARRSDEMQAVADALSLLANSVMAWNTSRMQAALDRWSSRRRTVPPELIGRVAPTRLEGINLRGVFRFPVERYAEQLLPSQPH